MLVYASGQCMEQQSCGCSQLWHSAPPGMAVGCSELRLRSTPRYRLVCNCFPDPGRGLPCGSILGPSRCLGPGECLHSFIHKVADYISNYRGYSPESTHSLYRTTRVPRAQTHTGVSSGEAKPSTAASTEVSISAVSHNSPPPIKAAQTATPVNTHSSVGFIMN